MKETSIYTVYYLYCFVRWVGRKIRNAFYDWNVREEKMVKIKPVCKRKCSRCGNPMIEFEVDGDEKRGITSLLVSKREESDFCVKCITPEEMDGLRGKE